MKTYPVPGIEEGSAFRESLTLRFPGSAHVLKGGSAHSSEHLIVDNSFTS